MADYTLNELRIVSLIKRLLEEKERETGSKKEKYIFSPSAEWMIINKTGLVPDNILDPHRLFLGRKYAIRDQIRGMPMVVLLREEAMPLFDDIEDTKENLIKIHNLNNPAVHVSFFSEHRYNFKPMEKDKVIKLMERSISLDRLESEEEDLIRKNMKVIKSSKKKVRFFATNYNLGYEYKSVSLKYSIKDTDKLNSVQHHIAKDKLNIIFISDKLINSERTHKKRYESKKIDLLVDNSTKVLKSHVVEFFSCSPEIYDEYELQEK